MNKDKKEKKPVPSKKGIKVPPPILNTLQKQEMVSKVMQWMMDGTPHSELIQLIRDNGPVPLTEIYALDLISTTRQTLEEESIQTASAVIAVHLSQYESIFAYGHDIECAPLVNKALKQKEKLLQLHKDESTLVINNRKKMTFVKKQPEYNINKLDSKEKIRFEELLKKAGG